MAIRAATIARIQKMFHVKLALSTEAYPNLTSMGRGVVDTGKQAAELLLKLIDGECAGHLMEEPYELRARASTGPAPAVE